ncbi:MAG: sugar-binding domain-containing protein [Wujia sp.]
MISNISLSGEWNFELDAEKDGIKNKYYAKSLSDTIVLPSTTSISKKGKASDKKEIGFLTDPYAFEGYAWYQRKIDLPDNTLGKNIFLHLERTRMTTVWINSCYVGENDSLTTPHDYDLTPFISDGSFILTILVSNVDYPTKGGHLTSPDTQTNWNGITGDISLHIYEKQYISEIKAFPDIESSSFMLKITTVNCTDENTIHNVSLAIRPMNKTGKCGEAIDTATIELSFPVGTGFTEYTYHCPDIELWSEYNPKPYLLTSTILSNKDETKTVVGMRKFSTTETEFLINGKPTFLRGKHDGLIFPLTGAAPTTLDEWLRVMSISKSYGINHYRFHTCCPPEAAFMAADLLGIYMEPQLPFWGTLTAPGDENHNQIEQDYLIEEGFRMMNAYGNHPSFCMMSLGNELWGSKERMAEIIREYRSVDNRHLYTQGSNNFQHTPVILPEDDFYVGVRFAKNRLIRGSYGMCDAPLGHIQWNEPSTDHNYDGAIYPSDISNSSDNASDEIEIQYGTGVKKVKAAKGEGQLVPHIPVVTHEIGQYAVYPNFREIDKYTGVLKARNFEVFRDRLKEKGMLDQADDFFYVSGKLSVQCYKEELEAAARSSLVAGYQILDIQDFSGQGTALVGILDAFMDNKGHVTRNEWSCFCSDGILMAQFPHYIYTAGDVINAKMAIRYYNPDMLISRKLHWELKPISCYEPYSLSAPVCFGDITIPDGSTGLVQLGTADIIIPESDKAVAYELSLSVPGTTMHNHYELYSYPKQSIPAILDNVATIGDGKCTTYVTNSFEEADSLLQEGKRVLFMPLEIKESLEGFYCTDFWCYPMFRDICEWMKKPVAVGTMGLLINHEHPAIADMLSHKYSTPQWYQIVTDSSCAILDDVTDKDYRPIIQMVDNFERNHKLGILFEGKVGNGTLMVCTSRLSEHKERPEIKQFAAAIMNYVTSDSFKPAQALDMSRLSKIFV